MAYLLDSGIFIEATSPRTFPVCAAIVSRLLGELKPAKERIELIKKIDRKLAQLPNTGHMEVWLQRISQRNPLRAWRS